MSGEVAIAVEFMNDAMVASSPGADVIVDPRFDGLMRQLPSNRVVDVSLTEKICDRKNEHDRMGQEYEDFVRNM